MSKEIGGDMKFGPGTMLASTLLLMSVFSNAQITTPSKNSQDLTHPAAVAAPVDKDSSYDAMTGGAAADGKDNLQNQKERYDRNIDKPAAPDEPKKSPFAEPKDWNYIEEMIGG